MITYHNDLIQGSDEWLAARCGILTASEMKLVLTPTLKPANNDKERCHLYELLAQRITGHVEPHYVSDDMLRGHEDEVEARIVYAEKYSPVIDMGFITNTGFGFTLGFSPDGLVGEDGFVECKSRRQKYQIETVLDGVPPQEYILQIQTGFLVSGRKWCDFISYSGGLPMAVMRVWPDPKIAEAILSASYAFEQRLTAKLQQYKDILASDARLVPTKRRVEVEITL